MSSTGIVFIQEIVKIRQYKSSQGWAHICARAATYTHLRTHETTAKLSHVYLFPLCLPRCWLSEWTLNLSFCLIYLWCYGNFGRGNMTLDIFAVITVLSVCVLLWHYAKYPAAGGFCVSLILCNTSHLSMDRDGAVIIATRYRLDGLGIKSWWGWCFPHLSGPALSPTQSPLWCVLGHSQG